MIPFRSKLTRVPILKALASVKIAVVCLCLLFILTWWGTVDQVQNGLYHAQEQFFHSFFFMVFGFLPFPGAQLVLWILFVNLLCVAIVRFNYLWKNIGILIIHFGLLLYFVAAFVTLHCVEESHLSLWEGESSNVSQSYRDWELSIWRQEGDIKKVAAYDAKFFKPGQGLKFSEQGFEVIVKAYYANAQAFGLRNAKDGILNASGIQTLQPLPADKEPEKNQPGGIFVVKYPGAKDAILLLYGAEVRPTPIQRGKDTYYFMLRHMRYVLPIQVHLIDFMMETHPNTQVARSYKSKVEIEEGGTRREVIIFMNNPLRYKNYTFYQASYAIDPGGREQSTLAVVKNSGRILPYAASLITFAGLAIHFLGMALASRINEKRKAGYV